MKGSADGRKVGFAVGDFVGIAEGDSLLELHAILKIHKTSSF